MSTVVHSADLVVPITAPSVLDGAVAVSDGRIRHVGDRDWVLGALRAAGEDAVEVRWPGVLLPGLVNAHTHLQYTGMAELGQRIYSGFDDWVRAFNAVYDDALLDWGTDAAEGARLSLSHGTTCLADVVTDAAAASALHDAGLHGVAYWEVMDWSNEDWSKRGPASVLAAVDAMPDTPGVGISPHAPYSLDSTPLLELPDLARHRGMRIHIHLGESLMEAVLADADSAVPPVATAGLWRDAAATSFTALRADGRRVSATAFVDELGVLGPDCHIAHGVFLGAEDRRRLRARGTAVALCPRSNAVIGLPEPPVAAYLSEGNLVAVGTDSLSSSPSLDILGELAVLERIARDQGYHRPDLSERLLRAATLGGAMALGLATGRDRVGQLQAGAVADMVVLDVPVTDIDSTLDEVVRSGAGRQLATLVDGVVRWVSPRAQEIIDAAL